MQRTEDNSMHGNTKLHHAARNCASLEDFMLIIGGMTKGKIIQNSLTANDKGKLPIDMINSRLPREDRKQIYSQLLKFSLMQKTKDLYEAVSFQEVLSRYQPESDSKLFHNLKNACEIVNETRAHMKNRISLSHPSMNGMSNEELDGLYRKLRAHRNNRDHHYDRIFLKRATFEKDADNINLLTIKITEEIYSRIMECEKELCNAEINNCSEMAKFSYLEGKKRELPVAMYCYIDETGDHVFNGIDDTYKENPINKIDNCSKDGVVFDSWAGVVCLASDYQMKLGDYRWFNHKGKSYNVITKINPRYNVIKTMPIVDKPGDEIISYLGMNLDFESQLLKKLLLPVINENTFSPYNEYLFLRIIQDNLVMCKKNKLISKNEIRSWSDPLEKLKEYFSSDYQYLPLVTHLYSGDKDIYKKKICKALRHGVNPNQSSLDGKTALHEAVLLGYNDIVQILLNGKADPNLFCYSTDKTPLMVAAEINNFTAAIQLLKAGANPNSSGLDGGATALFIAALMNHSKMIDVLLDSPEITFQLFRQTECVLYEYTKGRGDDIQNRMLDHISARKRAGEKSSFISIRPDEIAFILGYTEITAKLTQARNKSIKTEKISNVSSLYNHKATLYGSKPIIKSTVPSLPKKSRRCVIF